MTELLAQIMAELRHEFISACNTAVWSVGEMALHLGYGALMCLHFIQAFL
jgi:hypothetical protein